MKRFGVLLMLVVLFTGCTGKGQELDHVMALRGAMLGAETISFQAEVTADYGDALHEFSVECQGDNRGDLRFEVIGPESISGITGEFASGQGKLTFDDVALAFPLLADGQISPVSGPWIFLKTLLGGYLTSCCQEGEYLRVTIDDSYADDALQLDIWLDEDEDPVRAEISFDGRRIVTMDIEDFEIS